MSTPHVVDELSAYIDGEAPHPERIARHLQHCTACAQRHMALLRLSSHVQALPGPLENPDFLGRVLAEVGRVRAAEELRPRRMPVSRWAPWAGLAVAAALVLGIGLGWRALNPPAPGILATLPSEAPMLGEEALVAELSALLEGGADMALFEPVDALDDAEGASAPEVPGALDAWLVALAASAASDIPEGPAVEEDVYSDVESLDGQEAVAFQALLATYLNEG